MGYKKAKNLLATRDVYNAYYGNFRGVDFSSDHTQVHEARLAYAVNMYKDYQTGQGQAIETIPGFRRRVDIGNGEIYGIHYFRHNGELRVLIHAGKELYLWHNYPNSIGLETTETIVIPDDATIEAGRIVFALADALASRVTRVKMLRNAKGRKMVYEYEDGRMSILEEDAVPGNAFFMTFIEGELTAPLFEDMNERKSTSFVFLNRLYLIDGKHYLVYDGDTIKPVADSAYIPTTHIGIIPNGANADTGKEYERRNLLQKKFKHTFVGDGKTNEFYMNEKFDRITEVKVYGETLEIRDEGEWGDATDHAPPFAVPDPKNGKITFYNYWDGGINKTGPPSPSKSETRWWSGEYPDTEMRYWQGGYPEGYAGIEITAEGDAGIERITGCTLAAVYDERVFLSGNPNYPNTVFFSGINPVTRLCDPGYFAVDAYQEDGIGQSPITGMLVVADALMVLKGDTQQDGSVYYHTPSETGDDLYPKIYPSVRGLAGIGCYGACINFLDDPVFVSRLGVEAIGQLSVRYERAIEHRSSLVDAKLVNMDLSRAVLEEWNGYLILLVDGKIFMADSRQRYTHEIGVMQYEWYYLEDIGIYRGQYPEYRYASELHPELDGACVEYCRDCGQWGDACTCTYREDRDLVRIPLSLHPEKAGEVANEQNVEGNPEKEIHSQVVEVNLYGMQSFVQVNFDASLENGEAYLCETKGNYTGGSFHPACAVRSMDENLFFGTEDGVICSFNFDMRNENGDIPSQYYHFDERTIHCGCATKMDCCGIPHLNKNTVKKSTVVKTRMFPSSAAKIRVRTNKNPYHHVARINSTLFSFESLDFSDLSFITSEHNLFAIKEKEKKWVEKQYYIYSDEYTKPFSLFYISFRYQISGRYKG